MHTGCRQNKTLEEGELVRMSIIETVKRCVDILRCLVGKPISLHIRSGG